MAMDIRKIKKLIELVQESGISELEVTEGEESVRISRYPAQVTAPSVQHYVTNPQTPLPPQANANLSQDNRPVSHNQSSHSTKTLAQAQAQAQNSRIDGTPILSPMVGTFYRAPSPEAKDFVDIGTHVSQGDTLCVIEAMKMMHQIQADVAGTITAILVNSGDTVEFDQPLFVIG